MAFTSKYTLLKLLKLPGMVLLFCLLFSCRLSTKNSADHPLLVKTFADHANGLLTSSPATVIPYLNSAYHTIYNPGPGDLYQKYLVIHGLLHEEKNFLGAELYADSMLTVLHPHADDDEYKLFYAQANLFKGDELFEQKRFNEAYFYYYQGQMATRQITDSCANAIFFTDLNERLANVSYGQGRFKEAGDWNKKAIASLRVCGNDTINYKRYQGMLDNTALCYSRTNQPDSALYFYDKALEVLNRIKPASVAEQKFIEEARGVIYGNQASAYMLVGRMAAAEKSLKQSIAINSQKGYATQDALLTRIKLADLYVKIARIDDAKIVLDEINASADTLPELKDHLKLLSSKAVYDEATNNKASAYDALKEYVAIRNKLEDGDKKLMATDFSTDFDLLKRNYDLDELRKKNQLKSVYLIAAALFCLLAGVIIYLMMRGRRMAKIRALESIDHNQQLELTMGALEKSNHEYAQLIRVVAHDLKNPINAIYGISTLMTDDEGRSAEDKEMLELIRISSMNLNTIIYDLLADKINQDPNRQDKEDVDVYELLNESVSLLQFRAQEKNQKIILSEGLTSKLYIDRDRIWRVVNNLIVNAIKFSPENSTISVDWKTVGEEAIIAVKDEGIGVPDELKEKIFQLFSDAKRRGTAGEEPFGLGLYISKQIITEHGGRIWMENNKRKGATFYISLPIEKPSGEVQP